jgi:hypothetical protein
MLSSAFASMSRASRTCRPARAVMSCGVHRDQAGSRAAGLRPAAYELEAAGRRTPPVPHPELAEDIHRRLAELMVEHPRRGPRGCSGAQLRPGSPTIAPRPGSIWISRFTAGIRSAPPTSPWAGSSPLSRARIVGSQDVPTRDGPPRAGAPAPSFRARRHDLRRRRTGSADANQAAHHPGYPRAAANTASSGRSTQSVPCCGAGRPTSITGQGDRRISASAIGPMRMLQDCSLW